jgi:hypothetical protein
MLEQKQGHKKREESRRKIYAKQTSSISPLVTSAKDAKVRENEPQIYADRECLLGEKLRGKNSGCAFRRPFG